MKPTPDYETHAAEEGELKQEYAFDYGEAKPNRFAHRLTGKRKVVVLDPDVAEVFTTTEAVNTMLRAVIRGMPKQAAK